MEIWNDSRYQAVYELAVEYENRCESYDKTVCSGKSARDGCSMPVGRMEFTLVNVNARKVMREILQKPKALQYNVTSNNIMKQLQMMNGVTPNENQN